MSAREASLAEKLDDARKEVTNVLYALAITYARCGLKHVARGFAEECVHLLRERGTDTLDDCARTTIRLDDVFIPELLHEGIVNAHLRAYGIELTREASA